MIGSASPHQKMILGTVVAGALLLAAMWMLALSPKRSESAEVKTNVAAQEQRLTVARTELASFQAAEKQFPGMLAELRRLDKAVPARGAIPDLLRQLQKRANGRDTVLRLAELKAAGPAAGGALTPGATPMAGGLAALPFKFTYSGKYFDLVSVLKAARKAVTVKSKSGDLEIDGRLVTIEGTAFARESADSPIISASVSGTAYIAAVTAAPPTTVAAPAAPQGGS
jgi:Tfp pilus assembly protein PilO